MHALDTISPIVLARQTHHCSATGEYPFDLKVVPEDVRPRHHRLIISLGDNPAYHGEVRRLWCDAPNVGRYASFRVKRHPDDVQACETRRLVIAPFECMAPVVVDLYGCHLREAWAPQHATHWQPGWHAPTIRMGFDYRGWAFVGPMHWCDVEVVTVDGERICDRFWDDFDVSSLATPPPPVMVAKPVPPPGLVDRVANSARDARIRVLAEQVCVTALSVLPTLARSCGDSDASRQIVSFLHDTPVGKGLLLALLGQIVQHLPLPGGVSADELRSALAHELGVQGFHAAFGPVADAITSPLRDALRDAINPPG